jgi:hypothetical protein
MWFGTENIGFRASPSRFNSIAAATIVNVLPAPTTWASSVLGVCRMRHTPAFWCPCNWIAPLAPGNVRWSPLKVRTRV